MEALLLIGKVVFAWLFGLASFVLLWFTVSMVQLFWMVPFGSKVGPAIRGIFTSSPVPDDAAGWVLILSGVIVFAGLSWIRNSFINDLAKAIERRNDQ